jgi:hypothetical protein
MKAVAYQVRYEFAATSAHDPGSGSGSEEMRLRASGRRRSYGIATPALELDDQASALSALPDCPVDPKAVLAP